MKMEYKINIQLSIAQTACVKDRFLHFFQFCVQLIHFVEYFCAGVVL